MSETSESHLGNFILFVSESVIFCTITIPSTTVHAHTSVTGRICESTCNEQALYFAL